MPGGSLGIGIRQWVLGIGYQVLFDWRGGVPALRIWLNGCVGGTDHIFSSYAIG